MTINWKRVVESAIEQRYDGADIPTDQLVAAAVAWFEVNNEAFGQIPNITVNPFSEIVAEYLSPDGKRRATVYFRDNLEVEYLAAWGPHMMDDMVDGPLHDAPYLAWWLQTPGEPFNADMAQGVVL